MSRYRDWYVTLLKPFIAIAFVTLIYSTRNFICRGHFPVFLIEILLKIEFQWQFWILLVLRISKHTQKVEFDEDLAELLKVKHNTSHMKNFQLLSQQQNL